MDTLGRLLERLLTTKLGQRLVRWTYKTGDDYLADNASPSKRERQ